MDKEEFLKMIMEGLPSREAAEANLGPNHIKYGNEIVDYARKAIKESGWETCALSIMLTVSKFAAIFATNIPNFGRPGQTIETTEKFHNDYQEMMGCLGMMTAILAEKVGANLKRKEEQVN